MNKEQILENLTKGLPQDYNALKAALIYCWGDGRVERQVNRLKTIKIRYTARPILTCCTGEF